MQITSENAAENVIQFTSVIVQRIYADYTWNGAQNLLEEYKKEENESKKEPTRSLVKFTTVGLGNELVIFSSGCALFALHFAFSSGCALLALHFACALLPSLLFVACKTHIGIRRILSLFLSWIRVCTFMSEHHAAVDTAAVESETMKKPPLVDRALIVGGGLGGLAAAIQLRTFGIDAQVRQADRELFL
jgi:hypothetical protein